MKNHLIAIFAFLSISLLMSCGGTKQANEETKTTKPFGVSFMESNSLQTVLDKADKKNRLVFLDIYTTWCAPCKMMDQYVFTDPGTKEFMDKNFINYKVDAEKGNGQAVATIYQATTFPTLLFLDKDGKILERREGATSITELKDMANRALAAQNN